MKSLKHEHLFYLHLYTCPVNVVISTAQTALGLECFL